MTTTVNGDTDASRTAEAWAAQYWVGRVETVLAGVDDAEARADLRLFFEERAGICEFDGGLSQFAAEQAAFELLAGRMTERG